MHSLVTVVDGEFAPHSPVMLYLRVAARHDKVKGVVGLQFALDRSNHVGIVVEVEEAKHLACGDVSDKSDPFVRLLWGEWKVGQTNVIMNDQDPIWEEEKFVLPMKRSAKDKLLAGGDDGSDDGQGEGKDAAGDDDAIPDLKFEVRDFDAKGLGDNLGEVIWEAKELLLLAEEGDGHEVTEQQLYNPPGTILIISFRKSVTNTVFHRGI